MISVISVILVMIIKMKPSKRMIHNKNKIKMIINKMIKTNGQVAMVVGLMEMALEILETLMKIKLRLKKINKMMIGGILEMDSMNLLRTMTSKIKVN